MKILDAAALAALENGKFAKRNLVYFDLPSSPQGFWDEVYDINLNSRQYAGKAGRFTISPISMGGGLAIKGITVTFPSVDAEVLAMIQNQTWRRQPVTCSMVYLNPDSNNVIAVNQWFAGLIDKADWDEQPGKGDLVIGVETLSRELNRHGTRTRSDADQKQFDGNDGFFKHVTQSVETPIFWGRNGPE